jgi:amino acid transporter
MSYSTACVALASLRRQDPGRARPFRLPLAGVLAPFGFVVANLVIYWSGWGTVWRLEAALGIGAVLFLAYRLLGDRARMPRLDLRPALWLPPYLVGVLLISLAGRYKGGRNWIPFWWDVAIVAVFSLAVFALAVYVRLPAAAAQEYVEDLDPMIDDEIADAPLTREG